MAKFVTKKWYSLGTSKPITSKNVTSKPLTSKSRNFENILYRIPVTSESHNIEFPLLRKPITSNTHYGFRSNGIRSPEAKPKKIHISAFRQNFKNRIYESKDLAKSYNLVGESFPSNFYSIILLKFEKRQFFAFFRTSTRCKRTHGPLGD